jgi:hypothetical protein
MRNIIAATYILSLTILTQTGCDRKNRPEPAAQAPKGVKTQEGGITAPGKDLSRTGAPNAGLLLRSGGIPVSIAGIYLFRDPYR